AVQHEVDADVAQVRQLVAARRHFQQVMPAGNLQSLDRILGIRVLADAFAAPDAFRGHPGGDVDANADGTLVQVGLAVGHARGQSHHGHHRVALEHDDADVRHAL